MKKNFCNSQTYRHELGILVKNTLLSVGMNTGKWVISHSECVLQNSCTYLDGADFSIRQTIYPTHSLQGTFHVSKYWLFRSNLLTFLSLLSDDASRCSFPTPEALQPVIIRAVRMKGDFYTRQWWQIIALLSLYATQIQEYRNFENPRKNIRYHRTVNWGQFNNTVLTDLLCWMESWFIWTSKRRGTGSGVKY